MGLLLTACAAAVRPQTVDAQRTAAVDGSRRASPADVAFMQGMIAHHAQALEMTALVPTRAARPEMHLLAERIQVSQEDEIALMQRWLRARGEAVPDEHAHHGAAHARMPGMLIPEEMASLAAASGAAFDRLFLELMIRHHEGALVMVEQLMAAGGGQDPEIFQMAADVDADQRAEIARMRRLLSSLP